jgi:hypothetical protein
MQEIRDTKSKIIFTCTLEGKDFVTVCDVGHERQTRFNLDLTLAPLMLVIVLACVVIPVLRCPTMKIF